MKRAEDRSPPRWGRPALVAAVVASQCLALSSRAQELNQESKEPPARFALIVGVNASLDPDASPLHYADDDAAGFHDLFRTLGARTYLVSRFDDNTRRLHPQAAAEAHDPKMASFRAAIMEMAADVARARARGVPTVAYFAYAGHGNVREGRGYLALEDERLFGADIERMVLDQVHADKTHVIVDACYSVFLAFGRGPGGRREDIRGFSTLGGLGARANVGLLLSTSSARESHEWSEFQAGVFSHEVRSGLLGAADANGDGHVTYREIGAFVDRANAKIPNEKFRPDVYVKAPVAAPALVDLRPGLNRRLEVGRDQGGHFWLEDGRGVRLADFHKAAGQSLALIREPSVGPLYLRRTNTAEEYVVDAGPDVLRWEDLARQSPQTQPRGAVHESFGLLFAAPFSQANVDAFVEKEPATMDQPRAETRSSWKRPVALGLVGAGGAALLGGTGFVLSAWFLKHESSRSQVQIVEDNRQIGRRNTWAKVSYGIGGVLVGAGLAVAFWPKAWTERSSQVALDTDGTFALLSYGSRF